MDSSLSFSPREWTELYARRAYDELSERFLTILTYFAESTYSDVDIPTQRAIDAFVLNFLHLFSKVDYTLSPTHGIKFVERNGTISNLVALSVLKTTDPYLEVLRHQENSLVKILRYTRLATMSTLNVSVFSRRTPNWPASGTWPTPGYFMVGSFARTFAKTCRRTSTFRQLFFSRRIGFRKYATGPVTWTVNVNNPSSRRSTAGFVRCCAARKYGICPIPEKSPS